MTEGDQFIDAEQHWSNEKDSYEAILLNQIQKCVEILSKDLNGSVVQETKRGQQYINQEDLREVLINSVDTLRILLLKFYINSKDSMKEINKIRENIKRYTEITNEKLIIINGKKVKLKEANVSKQHPLINNILSYTAIQYRNMFEVLMVIYNKEKQRLKELEFEEDEFIEDD